MSASEVQMFQAFANHAAPASRPRTFEEAVAAPRASAESVASSRAPSVAPGGCDRRCRRAGPGPVRAPARRRAVRGVHGFVLRRARGRRRVGDV